MGKKITKKRRKELLHRERTIRANFVLFQSTLLNDKVDPKFREFVKNHANN